MSCRRNSICSFLAAILLSSTLEAVPEGFMLIDGSAMPPVTVGNTTTIESGARAIVEWDSFSLRNGEIVQFNQMDGSSAILNRVVGADISEIYGQIGSNGMVYLINPNGVLIGSEGQVLSSGFLASTLDVMNAEFMAGMDLLFTGASEGAVYNLGTIECAFGDAILIGRFVRNEGSISAPNGLAGMASDLEVLVKTTGDSRISVRTMAPVVPPEPGPLVEQLGSIEAMSAEIRSGYNPYVQGIKHTGTIEATGVAMEGGRVYLVSEDGVTWVNGSVKATNSDGTGGEIQILGREVALMPNARIDVSGDTGGGIAYVGGGVGGMDPMVMNADSAIVKGGSVINANAVSSGDGGTVVVWGDNIASYYGYIEAKGGAASGDGGFVEISGAYLDFRGLVDRSAPNGMAGTLLLDPTDITISNAADMNIMPPPPYVTTATPANISILGGTGLVANLGLGPITITTVSAFAGTGNITITDNISWAAANALTLIAEGSITLSPGVTISNTAVGAVGDIMDFTANLAGTTAGTFTGIDFGAGCALSAVDGNIVLNGTSGFAGAFSEYGIRLPAGALALITTSGTGDITMTGTSQHPGVGSASGIFISDSTVSCTGTGSISMTGVHTGASADFFQSGTQITSSSTVSTTSGTITIMGTGAPSTGGGAVGVDLSSSSSITSNTGSITLTGIPSPMPGVMGAGNFGIQCADSSISVTASIITSTITLDGTGAATPGGGSSGILAFDTSFSCPNGTIDLTGLGQAVGGVCNGIQLSQTVTGCPITATNISLTGTGSASSTGSDNNGLNLSGLGTIITCNGGTCVLTGTGGTGTFNNAGINIGDAQVVSTAAGNLPPITLMGTGGAGSTLGNHGIYLNSIGANPGTVQTTDRNIVITGVVSSTGPANSGVQIDSGLVRSTGTGNITVDGTAGPGAVGTGSNNGFGMGDSSGGLIEANNGSITIIGNPNAITPSGGSNNQGVSIRNDCDVRALGTASITITGNGSTGGVSNNDGIDIDDAGTLIQAVDGDIAMTGAGGGNGSGVGIAGIIVHGSADIVSTGTGMISLTGTGGTSGSNNQGVRVADAGTLIQTTNGNMTLMGTGGGPAGAVTCPGISVEGSSIVESVGTGNVNLTGMASPSFFLSPGITVQSSAIVRANTTGAQIILDGTGNGSGLLAGSHGVTVNTSGSIQSNAPGAATISITGIGSTAAGSNAYGVDVSGAGTITTVDGAININSGTGGSPVNGFGVNVSGAGSAITASGAGPITIIGDGQSPGTSGSQGVRISDAGALVQTTNGDLTITGTGGTATGATCPGINVENSAIVESIGTGNVNLMGVAGVATGSSPGVVVQTSAIVRADTTGSQIILDGTGSGTGSGNHGVTVNGMGSIQSIAPGAATIAINGTGSTAAASDAYGVDISGMGTITTVDGGISINQGTGGSPVNGYGVNISGAGSAVTGTGAGAVTIIGDGNNGTSGNRGVSVTAMGAVTATNGIMTITGTGGASAGADNPGVYVDTATITQAGAAAMNITGTGGAGPAPNVGVELTTLALVTSTSNSAPITITGTRGGLTSIDVLVNLGAVVSSTMDSPISVNAVAADCVIRDNGTIESLMTGLITMTTVQDLDLFGESNARIRNTDGDVSLNIGRDLHLAGGVAVAGYAQIGNDTAAATGSILAPSIGRNVNILGSDNLSWAAIGHGNPTVGATPLSGNIDFSSIAGDLNVSGATIDNAGTFGSAQVGHMDTTGMATSMSGDITMNVLGNVNVDGGTVTGGGVYALIGHGGHSTTSTVPSGNISFTNIAGGLNVTGGTGIAGATTAFAQIGHSAPTVTSSNITFPVIGGTGITLDGLSTSQYAIIGHGRDGVMTTGLSGLISFSTINGSLTVQGAINPGGALGFAQIGHMDNAGFAPTLSGDLLFTTITGDLNLNGGTSAGEPYAMIGHGGRAGMTTVTPSDIAFDTIGGTVALTGGTVASGFTQVGHNTIDATGDITFTDVAVDVNIHQASLNTYSIIGHGSPTLAVASNVGNISFTTVGNNIDMFGATVAGAGAGFSQIGHVAMAGTAATFSGDIFGHALNSMFFIGATQVAGSAYTRVGHGNEPGAVHPYTVGPSNILLIADRNITLQSTAAGFGVAQIVNQSQTPNHSNVTLVTDNEFPASPGIGPNFFFIDPSIIFAYTPNTGFTGQVRIYTARLGQNTILSPINGLVFPIPIEGLDDNYNQFCYYYPDGPYMGPEFVVYYKTPCPEGTTLLQVVDLTPFIIAAQVANDQLRYLLPFNLPQYSFRLCSDSSTCVTPEKMPEEWENLK